MQQLRLPQRFEIEFSKLLNTLGFSAYGKLLWDFATAAPAARRTVLPAAVPLADVVFDQVAVQARHDPSIVAAGDASAASLPRRRRDLRGQGVSAARLFAPLRARPAVVLIVGRLDSATVGITDALIATCRSRGASSFAIIVTEPVAAGSGPAPSVDADRIDLIYWQEGGGTQIVARRLALAIHAMGPAAVVSVRSRLGHEALGRYGRALCIYHRLFAVLDGPKTSGDGRASTSRIDTHHLRLLPPHATILTLSRREADVLRATAIAPSDASIRSLEETADVLGDDFADSRTVLSRSIADRLLKSGSPTSRSDAGPRDRAYSFDVTVTIVCHRERELAVPALASMHDMVQVARNQNLRVETQAVLDLSDEATRDCIRTHGAFLDNAVEVGFGDLPLARNAGVAHARGHYLTFLDGDDLWGAEWLSRSYAAATADGQAPAIWHAEALMEFFASDFSRTADDAAPGALTSFAVQQCSTAPNVERANLLLENLWSANAFAHRSIFEAFPYRATDAARQIGIEDWRWNFETLGHGIEHLVVPGTVHLIRAKEDGSLGQEHDRAARLPLLCRARSRGHLRRRRAVA